MTNEERADYLLREIDADLVKIEREFRQDLEEDLLRWEGFGGGWPC